MSYTRPIGKESLAEAMKLIATEGMKSEFQIRKIKKKIDRYSRKNGWDEALFHSLDPEWQWRVCCARLQLGHLDWKGWEWRDPRPIRRDLPLWRGESGRVLLHKEQGLGDEIMFASCVPDLLKSDIDITWECDDRLKDIFKRSFPNIDVVGGEIPDKDYDYRLPIGHLPTIYRTRKESFIDKPYLIPDQELAEKWGGWLKDKPKVGMAWKGRQGYIPPMDLMDDPVVNLQYGNIDVPENVICPPIDLTNSIDDVFAIVANLDRVVCVPNSILHIAGSIGVKCDVVLSPGTGEVNNALNWRFGMNNRMNFHPSVTVHRSLHAYKRRV